MVYNYDYDFYFSAELVDVESLKYITPAQCNLLSAEFPLGIRIKFVAKVMQWRGY